MNKAKCTKVSYSDRAEAKQDIIFLNNQRVFNSKRNAKAEKGGRKLRAYECMRCGKWHVTSYSRVKYNRGKKS